MKTMGKHRAVAIAVIVAVMAAVAGGAWALVVPAGKVIRACANKQSGALRLAVKCKKTEKAVSWNVTGPRGPQGIQGVQGITGAQGIKGDKGDPGAGLNVVSRSASATVPAASNGTQAAVSCNPGERAIAGGNYFGGRGVSAFADVPTTAGNATSDGGTPDGWMFWFRNTEPATAYSGSVYVICASP